MPVTAELQEPGSRAAAAWPDAGASAWQRRWHWPWAPAAALAGAVLGVAAALLVRRVFAGDRPEAQDPQAVRAVVDRSPGHTAPSTPPAPDPEHGCR